MPSLDALIQAASKAKKIVAPDRPALINMVPRALQQDLGPGRQTPEAWLAQLRNRPGVSPKELGEMFARARGPLSSAQLMESAVVPKRYAQRAGVRQRSGYDDRDEAHMELAMDMLWQRNDPRMRGGHDQALADYLGSLSEPDIEAENLARNFRRVSRRPVAHPERIQWRRAAEAHQEAIDTVAAETHGSQYSYEDFVHESDSLMDLAIELANEDIARNPERYMVSPGPRNPAKIATEKYSAMQRQLPTEGPVGPYFESVLRVSPRRALETGLSSDPNLYTSGGPYHFSNKGQLGHIRGSIQPDDNRNIMLLDEIQADPLEIPGPASPDLRNVYGQLGNMAVERAAAADLPAVAFPTGKTITGVRNRNLKDFYERVYDRDIGKNVFEPLHKRGFTINSNPAWSTVELPEEARKALLDPSRRILGYAQGGAVQPLQERISALHERAARPQHLAGGGIVGKAVKSLSEFLRPSVVKPERGGNWLGMTPGGRSDKYFNDLKKPISLPPNVDYTLSEMWGIPADAVRSSTAWRQGHGMIDTPLGPRDLQEALNLLRSALPQNAQPMALNRWAADPKGPLRKYVTNDMATPGDPVRAYAEQRSAEIAAARTAALAKAEAIKQKAYAIGSKANPTPEEIRVSMNLLSNAEQAARLAEQEHALAQKNIFHVPLDSDGLEMTARKNRSAAGLPMQTTGQSMAAQTWDTVADAMVRPYTAFEAEMAQTAGGVPRFAEDRPWLSKLPPHTQAYRLSNGDPYELGFDHLIDSLQGRMTQGLLRPEKLQAVTVPQAIRWAADDSLAAARKMAEARSKSMEGMPVAYEHPTTGHKIVQLTRPGEFAAESDAMGHSVKGYEPPKVHRPSDTDMMAIDDILGLNSPTEQRMMDELAAAGNNQPGSRDALEWLVKNHPREEKRAQAQELLDKLAEGKHPDWIPESGDMGNLGYGVGDDSGFGGGWEAIKRGDAKVYSVRDPVTGETGATIEVARRPTLKEEMVESLKDPSGINTGVTPLEEEFKKRHGEDLTEFSRGRTKLLTPKERKDIADNTDDLWDIGHWLHKNRPDLIDPAWYAPPYRGTQIKGLQNAPVDPRFWPAIHDFIRNPPADITGGWASFGDLKNVGLVDIVDEFKGAQYFDDMFRELGGQRYVDPATLPDDSPWKDYLIQGPKKGRRGYAAGGAVVKAIKPAVIRSVAAQPGKVLSFPAKEVAPLPVPPAEDFLTARIRALLGRSDEGMTLDQWIRALEAKGYAKGGLVTAAAHEAATSPHNDLHEPTDAQKSAGNYRKGHVRIAGLDISIENPEGSRRKPEWPPLKHHYGYIRGTVGRDKDHIDVFVHPDVPVDFDGPVFVVDQAKVGNGHFDEHKVMLGFKNAGVARAAYRSNYHRGWKGDRAITEFANPEEFKAWLDSGDTKAPASQERA